MQSSLETRSIEKWSKLALQRKGGDYEMGLHMSKATAVTGDDRDLIPVGTFHA